MVLLPDLPGWGKSIAVASPGSGGIAVDRQGGGQEPTVNQAKSPLRGPG